MNVAEIKSRYKSGMVVVLEEMTGEEDMVKGLRGTIDFVDDIGQLHIKWENGRTLALIVGVDKFKVVGNEN